MINVVFVLHDDFDLVREVIPHNHRTLQIDGRSDVRVTFVVDRWATAPMAQWFDLAAEVGADQVLCTNGAARTATGHPSNNGHMHVPHSADGITISIEGDIAVFRTEEDANPLDRISEAVQGSQLPVHFRIDDHDQWATPLVLGEHVTDHVRKASRLSSHFLVYDDARYAGALTTSGGVPWQGFYEDEVNGRYYNFEDWLSTRLGPRGDRIGYLERPGLHAYHCDRKVAPGSEFYTGDVQAKLEVFHSLCQQHPSRATA